MRKEIFMRTAISVVHSASSSFLYIFTVYLPHSKLTITAYDDVVASAQLTILIVANVDVTIRPYANASAM